MKYYKRLPINRKDPMSNRFAVEASGRIVTTTAVGMQIPIGTVLTRSVGPANGEIRYNSEIGVGGELEAFINGKWEIIKTNRHAIVTKQEFDNGDYADTLFGPLAYDIDVTKPENLSVYVENVPQIPGTNFTLLYSSSTSSFTTSTIVIQNSGVNTTTIHVSSVADFNPGNLIYGTNIANGTTVVNTSATSLTITLSTATSGIVTVGTEVTTVFGTGTFVQFLDNSLPVPNKPVITLLGLDGYCPPFEV
jgi:hypothetical protein